MSGTSLLFFCRILLPLDRPAPTHPDLRRTHPACNNPNGMQQGKNESFFVYLQYEPGHAADRGVHARKAGIPTPRKTDRK